MKRITKIEANEKLQITPNKLRVAAYARVSTDSREQLASLEAQKITMKSISKTILTGSMLAFITMKVYPVQKWQNEMVF